MDKLSRSFYLRDAETVARDLLGKYLVHETPGGRLTAEITETEAYVGVHDKGCHAYGGKRTPRTQVMYLPGGHAYIYFIYGMYYLFNVVTGQAEDPCAVLVRQARPVEGLEQMALLRFCKPLEELRPAQKKGLVDGPGKFCGGMGLSKEQNTLDLTGDRLYLTGGRDPASFRIEAGKRINIDYAEEAADWPLRFTMKL